MPAICLLVSYADLNQDTRALYQASNWLYVGMTGYEAGITLNGKLTHRRTINSKYGSDIEWLRKRIDPNATRYEGNRNSNISSADDQSERIKSLSQPYPNAPQTKRTLRLSLSRRRRCESDPGAPDVANDRTVKHERCKSPSRKSGSSHLTPMK
jgi:hypothetical protein